MSYLIMFAILYSMLNLMGAAMFAVAYSEKEYYWGCPTYIFYNTTMNMFGSTMVTVICFVFVPVYFILWFIYWICHV